MSLRLVEITLPEDEREGLAEALREGDACRCVDVWCVDGPEERSVVRALVSTEHSEELLDFVVDRLGDEARIVVTAVEATLPRMEEDENEDEDEDASVDGGEDGSGSDAGKEDGEEDGGDDDEDDGDDESGESEPWVFRRISREELHADIVDSARMTPNYFAMVLASAVVAAIGLLKDDVAVIIGAMVIAPLLGPNVALALATTLGDLELAWKSLRVNAAGVTTALVPAAAMGFFLFPDDPAGQIVARSSAGFLDLAVALAAGGAGALSFTLGVPAALVGVMVAVALLPPLVLCGMAAGAADWSVAGGAALLTLVNVICVNLAGVVTFLGLGIRPASWFEAARARKATRIAILFWVGILAALAVLIYFTR